MPPGSSDSDSSGPQTTDSGSTDAGRLRSLYHEYIGDPDNERDIYLGFGSFFAGIALGVVGLCLFLYSNVLPPGTPFYWQVREVAFVAGVIGLPSVLLSVVVLLPVGRRPQVAGALGAVFCVAASVLLVDVFPYQWTTNDGLNGSVVVISVYAVGLVLIAAATGAALVAHYLDQATAAVQQTEASAPSQQDDADVSDADVEADIEDALDETELSWGGVEQTANTKRLNLDMPAVDSIDEAAAKDVEADVTRAEGADVDDAVAGLRQLQGGEKKTATSSGTESQVAALNEFREQQDSDDGIETGADDTPGVLSRLRRLLFE